MKRKDKNCITCIKLSFKPVGPGNHTIYNESIVLPAILYEYYNHGRLPALLRCKNWHHGLV